MLRTFALLDQVGQLDAVHPGHLDVEYDRGELAFEQQKQRLLCGLGPDQVVFRRLQQTLEDVEIADLIIDQKNVDDRWRREWRKAVYGSAGGGIVDRVHACCRLEGSRKILIGKAKPEGVRAVRSC